MRGAGFAVMVDVGCVLRSSHACASMPPLSWRASRRWLARLCVSGRCREPNRLVGEGYRDTRAGTGRLPLPKGARSNVDRRTRYAQERLRESQAGCQTQASLCAWLRGRCGLARVTAKGWAQLYCSRVGCVWCTGVRDRPAAASSRGSDLAGLFCARIGSKRGLRCVGRPRRLRADIGLYSRNEWPMRWCATQWRWRRVPVRANDSARYERWGPVRGCPAL